MPAVHVVCVKQDMVVGQSTGLPDGQGLSHDKAASSKLVPHIKVSVSSHVV